MPAAGGEGARAVLEVRSRDVPFILEDGQIVGRLVYERMAERPKVLYGAGAGSNYQAQGPEALQALPLTVGACGPPCGTGRRPDMNRGTRV